MTKIHKKRAAVKSAVSIILALTLTVSVSSFMPARADTLTELKSKYQELQKKQQQLQQQLSSLNSKVSSEKDKKEAISANVQTINQQIDVLNSQVAALNSDIESTNKDIDATQKKIEQNKKIYKERVCAIYEAGRTSKLEILLSSNSLKDFLTKMETIKIVEDHDTKLINDLKSEQTKLQNEKKSLEDKKKSLDTYKSTLVLKQMDVTSQLEQQKKIVSDLSKSKSQVASEKNTVSKQASKTNDQINDEIAKIAEQRRQELIKSGTYKVGSFVNGDSVVAAAEDQIGKRYVWGTAGPNTFDCSGLVQYCLACASKTIKAGDSADHDYRAIDLSGMGVAIPRNQLQPGDIVFFATGGGAINHCGIYVGNDQFIAANTGNKVKVMEVQECNLNDKYWSPLYRGAQRIKY